MNPELDNLDIDNKEKKATISFDENELNIILRGLSEMPHRVVDTLLRKIVTTAKEQIK